MTILVAPRTCRFSDTLRGIIGTPGGGLKFELPNGVGTDGFPRFIGGGGGLVPTIVLGRLGGSTKELVLGRGGISIVATDVGRSAPVSIPPLVARSFGIPPANIPPSPGAAEPGGGGAEAGTGGAALGD